MEKLQHGKYYHIYNRGNNREDLFRTEGNYLHFMRLYEKYIFPIAETFAWVLMKNHFHFLVRVREEEQIDFLPPIDASRSKDTGRSDDGETFHRPQDKEASNPLRKPEPSRQFAHLFNAYSKYYNRLNNRTGSLFEKNFHRIEVTSDRYFRQLVVYIHTNPVRHGFVSDFRDYPWSSYGTILSVKPTKLSRDRIIGWFDDTTNFVAVHNQTIDVEMITELKLE